MQSKIKNEHVIYALIFLVAAAIRLANLDLLPLNEFEAGWASQAYAVSRGLPVEIGPQPAYVFLTGFIFSIFGSSESAARFLPALVGSLIVLFPYALRYRIGRKAAIIFALGLAIDPGMVFVSRLAGGQMLALGFAALAAVAFINSAVSLATVFAALFLMSGPTVYAILISLAITIAFLYPDRLKHIQDLFEGSRRMIFTAGGLTILVVGTYLLGYPQGISGLGAALPTYFSGWVTPSGNPFWMTLMALPVYQPLALGFGVYGFIRAWRQDQPVGKFFGLWFIISLIVTLSYPSRQTGDLVLPLLPLWGAAAVGLAHHFKNDLRAVPPLTWANFGITFLLLAFFWLDLANLTSIPPIYWETFIEYLSIFDELDPVNSNITARIVIAIVIPVLVVGSTALIGAGWSQDEAWEGFVWGSGLFLVLYVFGVSYGGAQIRQRALNELWWPGSAPGLTDYMEDAAADIAEFNFGERASMDVVYLHDSPVFPWTFRNWPDAQPLSAIPEGEFPSAVLTEVGYVSAVLENAYIGQDFALNLHQANIVDPNLKFLRWLIFRDLPMVSEKAVLWVRADLFPEGGLIEGLDSQP